jgi:hypothetical protein
VTVFGLIFTPVFYVLCRKLGMLASRKGGRAAEATPPTTPSEEPRPV